MKLNCYRVLTFLGKGKITNLKKTERNQGCDL